MYRARFLYPFICWKQYATSITMTYRPMEQNIEPGNKLMHIKGTDHCRGCLEHTMGYILFKFYPRLERQRQKWIYISVWLPMMGKRRKDSWTRALPEPKSCIKFEPQHTGRYARAEIRRRINLDDTRCMSDAKFLSLSVSSLTDHSIILVFPTS